MLATAAETTAGPARPHRRRLLPGPWGLCIAIAAVAGARLGLRPISDNSTLVHLRTGIDLVHTWHVPRSDPYSYTAAGHAWVVQSWFASLLYGLADRVGHHALVLEQGALMAGVAAVTAVAARSSTASRSGLAALLAIAASAPFWSPRPLLFELLCLALVIVVVERDAHPLWLLPVVWLWVNTHGSWPIGLAWLGARAAGSAIDLRGWPRAVLVRIAGFAAGLVASLANPLTWRLVAFPLVAVQKRSTFQTIVEWRSPNFQDPNTLIGLVFMIAALALLLRVGLPWAHLLPVCGFLALGLVAERNLGPFAITLAPALGCALRGVPAPAPALARRWDAVWRHRAWRASVLGATLLAGAGLVVWSFQRRTLALGSYPVAAANFLERTGRFGPAHRVAAIDVVGCFLVWRAGPGAKDFIDDRYDMYPQHVVDDARTLADGREGVEAVLDRWRVDTVLWAANGTLPAELLSHGGWREAFDDGAWVVAVRT